MIVMFVMFMKLDKDLFIFKKLASSERVHNNCELLVGFYNICECMVKIRHKCLGPVRF